MFTINYFRWIIPPKRRTRIITTIIRVILVTLFISVTPAQAQEGTTDFTWLDSPTQPRATCGYAWGGANPAGAQEFHNAIDFCGGYRGGDVLAVAEGIVVYTGWWPKSKEKAGTGHGIIVAIWHPRNQIYTYDSHLQEPLVVVGQEVSKGQVIGLEGDTGYASGPHDHFATATKDPVTMEAEPCWNSTCWPNPDSFLSQDTLATDLGLSITAPTGEMLLPAPGTSVSVPEGEYIEVVLEDFGEDLLFDEEEDMTALTSGNMGNFSFSELPSLSKIYIIIFVLLLLGFISGFLSSKKFRKGTIYILLIAVPLVLLVIYLLPR